jgi:hypothetical protein
MSNPKPHWDIIFTGVPLVLTFVKAPAATRYECQNRDTSRGGFDIRFTIAASPHSECQIQNRKSSPARSKPTAWPRLSVTSASFSFNAFGNPCTIGQHWQNQLPMARSSFAQRAGL